MDYADESPPSAGADPTQRLLTALGRFQRQVNRAEGGAPDHQWIDECMEQLIEGIAISHENNWQDVKEALTDTARILQSYEEAGAASSAVPFLQDSYEILCLMVGDIIVDNVRSGVMNKWRQRYDLALNDLARHGVTLIDDDTTEAPPQPANIVRFAQAAAPAATMEHAFPFADPDLEEQHEEASDSAEDEATELPAMQAGIEEAAEEIAAWRAEEEQLEAEQDADVPSAVEADTDTDTDTFDDVEEQAEASLEDDDDAGDEISEDELSEDELAEDDLADEDLADEETAVDVATVEEEVAEALEEEAEAEDEEPPLPALDEVLFESTTVVETEEETDEEIEDEASAPDNILTLSTAAPTEAAQAAGADDFLFEAPAQTPRVPEPAQAAAPERDADDDVQALLRSAQQSMSRGDVAGAKVVALQMAVKMAELEVKRAKESLRAAEGRLEDTTRAIEIASEAVRRTESGVCDVEEQISQREVEYQEKREHIGALREEISSVHGAIASIDEQIKALQEQRALEERNLTALQDQLEQGIALEGRIQSDLDMLSQEEEAAREAQDAAKQRVRDLQRERLARESDINESRTALMLQERSVEDIQRTLQQVTAGPEPPAQESDLLF